MPAPSGFALSFIAWVRYWMPPAQCGLRAHAGPPANAARARTIEATRYLRTVTGSPPTSGQAVAVHREAEGRPQVLRRFARRQHSRHEDLEILHDLRNRGV